MRTFIAIKLPEEVRAEVRASQAELENLNLDAKWVEFDNLHITLKFLGEVKEEEAGKIKDIISGVSSLSGVFKLTLANIGCFPDLKRPRVIWVGISPELKPVKIIEYLEEKLFGLGIPRENRKPHPHITIVRLKSSKNIIRLEEKIEQIKLKNIPWDVCEVSLFKSVLTREGSVYEEIYSASLK